MENKGHLMSNEEMAMPASKGDIVRLHEKMDEFTRSLTVMSTALAVLQARPTYVPPCEFFKTHVAEHKANQNDWKKAMINGIVTIAVTLIAAALAYNFGVKQ